MSINKSPKYKRILLKMSGEALMGEQAFGLDANVVRRIAGEIRQLAEAGVEVAIVVGGGNLFRGAQLAALGMERVTGDHMGMLATLMNALAIQDALEQIEVPVRVMSALIIDQVCEPFIRRRAIRHLEKGRVVICAAGTGNPPTAPPVCAQSSWKWTQCSRRRRSMASIPRTLNVLMMR